MDIKKNQVAPMNNIIQEFHSTFGGYDESDITYPLWFYKNHKCFPWKYPSHPFETLQELKTQYGKFRKAIVDGKIDVMLTVYRDYVGRGGADFLWAIKDLKKYYIGVKDTSTLNLFNIFEKLIN